MRAPPSEAWRETSSPRAVSEVPHPRAVNGVEELPADQMLADRNAAAWEEVAKHRVRARARARVTCGGQHAGTCKWRARARRVAHDVHVFVRPACLLRYAGGVRVTCVSLLTCVPRGLPDDVLRPVLCVRVTCLTRV